MLYRIVTASHVLHQALDPKLKLTENRAWGEHCRKEALAHAALVDRYLSDGRDWLLGGEEPTFSDMMLCTAIAFSKYPIDQTPLHERFEQLGRSWRRCLAHPPFRTAYADRSSAKKLDEVVC